MTKMTYVKNGDGKRFEVFTVEIDLTIIWYLDAVYFYYSNN